MDKINMDWVVKAVEQRFGEVPYVIIVCVPDGEVDVTSNIGEDELITLLVQCAEHVGMNAPLGREPEPENGP